MGKFLYDPVGVALTSELLYSIALAGQDGIGRYCKDITSKQVAWLLGMLLCLHY